MFQSKNFNESSNQEKTMYQMRISELEMIVNQLSNENYKMWNFNQDLRLEYVMLKSENKVLSYRISEIKEENEMLNKQLNELKSKNSKKMVRRVSFVETSIKEKELIMTKEEEKKNEKIYNKQQELNEPHHEVDDDGSKENVIPVDLFEFTETSVTNILKSINDEKKTILRMSCDMKQLYNKILWYKELNHNQMTNLEEQRIRTALEEANLLLQFYKPIMPQYKALSKYLKSLHKNMFVLLGTYHSISQLKKV